MDQVLHWAFNCVVLYVLMVPVSVLLFLLIDRTIPPKNILPADVMWWAAWRWPITISHVIVAISVRMYIYYKLKK